MDNTEYLSGTNKSRWITVERAMLAAIILLQAAILYWIWKDHNLRFAGLATPVINAVARASDEDVSHGQRAAALHYRTLPTHRADQNNSHFANLHEADRIFDQMDAMFESAINDFGRMDRMMSIDDGWDALTASPAMDMKEQNNKYVVVFSLPGVRAHDVAVTIEGRILTVITVVHGGNGFGGETAGTFQRAIQLPGPVGNLQLAQAALTNGILRVSIPKSNGVESDGKPLKLL